MINLVFSFKVSVVENDQLNSGILSEVILGSSKQLYVSGDKNKVLIKAGGKKRNGAFSKC
jgi:hypothetical protein